MITNKYVWIGAGFGVLVAVFLAKKTADAVGNAVTTAAEAINPFNNDNIFNQGATELYQWVSGSDGEIGSDLWDYLHKAEPVPGGGAGLVNYTPEQQQRDQEATRQLEAGFHGM